MTFSLLLLRHGNPLEITPTQPISNFIEWSIDNKYFPSHGIVHWKTTLSTNLSMSKIIFKFGRLDYISSASWIHIVSVYNLQYYFIRILYEV